MTESDATTAIYPHPFKARQLETAPTDTWTDAQVVYTVTLHGEHLRTAFRVMNTGDQPLSFTGALHGYFEVDHVSKANVRGLKGLKVLDKVPNPEAPVEGVMNEELLKFDGHVDSVFLDASGYVELDVGTGAAIAVSTQHRLLLVTVGRAIYTE